MILAALIINAIGFLSLALANDRHREALLGRRRPMFRPRPAKTIGAILVAGSWLLLSCAAGLAPGLMLFAGLSTVGAAISVFSVTAGRHLRSR